MLNKQEFNRKMRRARRLTEQVIQLKWEILSNDELLTPFKGINSTTLDEAINCYIDYGELPLSNHFDDFYEAYKRAYEEQYGE
ncbi:hypothetical protein DDV21_005370 [Streptococcus chenjunshii]|uniref:Uncharacterized protein n=1 Tax=Streptococcus chenjunshii TaxID=2173853 RepID=A0A372KPI4_9STRE|nr:hypothetical protein [Streptococcus chenjunshii]AXQ78551.1 hypothetical protein DDV21_005370 [Streptococcus chenjunshii]RFU51987.1 hypothetical protein DDV22_00675 [Streptococcus chenjunshii]RFU54179.1 hypothetical protein DDV23_01230 [Streptococcus chenjunshii]